jgi:hypothetical protein
MTVLNGNLPGTIVEVLSARGLGCPVPTPFGGACVCEIFGRAFAWRVLTLF